MWNKLDREYKDELNGIVAGLHDQGLHYDSLDLTAYNAVEELAFYYVPQIMNRLNPGSGNNKAPGNCSAFIATGSYTKDGKIVMGHNNWTEYIIGQHWNVIADIVPLPVSLKDNTTTLNRRLKIKRINKDKPF